MRRFILYRDTDVSGYSGTGVVVEGIQFSDGSCAMRWRSEKKSTVVWENLEDLVEVHGHGGATRLVWVDAHPAHIISSERQPTLPGLEAIA